MKPRLFISAVSSELATTRQLVANVLQRLGYDPVWQEIFGTEPGDLRQMLRDKIDDCDGLIHLVGRGYGAEPPEPDAEFGRVSYTQFEFLYARHKFAQQKDKKTWVIFAEEGCSRDRPLEQLDLPRDPADPDPAGYQAERRALQDAWRTRLKTEGHLRHDATSDAELKLKINELNDEFRRLRHSFRRWQQAVTVALIALLVLGGGIWWTVFRQHADVKQEMARDQEGIKQVIQETAEARTKRIEEELAKIKPEEIKQQLRKTIEATYQQEVQAADKLTEWQKRDEAKRDAAAARDKRLGQVDEFLASITSTIKSGDASPEFLELTRIIQEQGVDQALAYITSQESRLLKRTEKLATEKQREIRRTLAPLLEGVRLHYSKGELAEAITLCEKLLKLDRNWLDLLHEYGSTMITLGRSADALLQFQNALKIRRELAEADPKSAEKQRDLMVSHYKLGEVEVQAGRYESAKARFQAWIEVLDRMIANGQNVADSQQLKKISEGHMQLCDAASLATGDWETLLKADAKVLPILLSFRATELAKRGKRTEFAQAGAKLHELAANAEKGSANDQQAGMLYNAACAYSLSGMLVTKDKPQPTEADAAERKKYLDLSLACLKEALAAGYDNFDHMRQDTDLKPLHGLPEFEALFPKKKED